MENIELHLDINAQVVIPEWLRIKMGVADADAENESEDRDDDTTEAVDAEAHRKALEKLAECLRDNGIADVAFTCSRHAVRRNRRG